MDSGFETIPRRSTTPEATPAGLSHEPNRTATGIERLRGERMHHEAGQVAASSSAAPVSNLQDALARARNSRIAAQDRIAGAEKARKEKGPMS